MSEFEPRGTLIDMHLHTTKGASDSMLEPDVLVEEAKNVGLTGINITEHDRMWDQWDITPFKDRNPELFINNGMEVATDMGHILAIGLNGYQSGIRKLEKLRDVADQQGAFLIVAHPFRHYFDPVYFTSRGLEPFKMTPTEAANLPVFQYVDAIEVLNGCNTPQENYFALEVARNLGKPGTGGSDAHSSQGIGYFSIACDEVIESSKHFVDVLHAGKFCPVFGLSEGKLQNFYDASELYVSDSL